MVDLPRAVYRCACSECRSQASGFTALDHKAINRVMTMLDERQRRLFAGLLAWRRGHGGILQVATITGLSRTTIRRGIAELRSGLGSSRQRIRRPGGGRRSLEKKIPRW